jgi:hypothetical protein
MTSLNDLENAKVPGVGNVDVTSPSDHIQLIAGVLALLGVVGVARYLFNEIKTRVGVDDMQSAIPEV